MLTGILIKLAYLLDAIKGIVTNIVNKIGGILRRPAAEIAMFFVTFYNFSIMLFTAPRHLAAIIWTFDRWYDGTTAQRRRLLAQIWIMILFWFGVFFAIGFALFRWLRVL